MTVRRDEVRRRVEAAYDLLLRHDADLLKVDANERSITHKLAEHLQREFPDWHVDCEYNRSGDLPKRLVGADGLVSTHDTDGRTVFPDIIVHRRGSRENLVVIEAKKLTTAQGTSDVEKLQAYKVEHGYPFAYAIVFPVGDVAFPADSGSNIEEVDA